MNAEYPWLSHRLLFLGALYPLGKWQAQSGGARLLIFAFCGWHSCPACPSQSHPKVIISMGDAT